jgi:ADP-heptose:LPS heptosyltransferase
MLPPLFLSVRVPTKLAIFWRAHLAPVSRAGFSASHVRSLLVIRLDGLGDVVLTTPLFRELKRIFPDASCAVVVHDDVRSLLSTNPNIDEIIALRPVQAAWLPARLGTLLSVLRLYWRRLRGRRFDIVISPRWEVDNQLATCLCSLVEAARRVGYTETASPMKGRHNRGFDAGFDTCLSAGPVQHEVLRNVEIARALGGKPQDSKLEIRLTQRDREFASKLLAKVPTSSRLVAVGFGGRSRSRRWPLENYAECLVQLQKHCQVQPIIICSRDERDEACKLANMESFEAIVVAGAPLHQVCAVLERCDLFLGNDTGSAHLAAAMECKVIVISRHPKDGNPNHPNSPVRFAPYCQNARVLQPATGVDTCRTECLSPEPHCIKAVSVDRVVAAAREMLEGDRPFLAIAQINPGAVGIERSRVPTELSAVCL